MRNRKVVATFEIVWPVNPKDVAATLKRFAVDGWKVRSITPISSNQTDIVFYK